MFFKPTNMSERKTVLAVHIHEDQSIEIEVALEQANVNHIALIGILEQIKYDMIKTSTLPIEKKTSNPKYDA